MPTNYPGAIDTTSILSNAYNDSTATRNEHARIHNNQADATLAIENELGVEPSGSFATVALRLANLLYQTPTETQIIQSTGDFVSLALRAHASQSANMLEVRASNNNLMGSINVSGIVNATGYQFGGAALASIHLSDSSSILKNPSPSITTPTISNATMTGEPVSSTPSTSDNSTRVATTAYVINQGYAKLASPNFTGTPTAPTPPVNNNSTRISTTKFVVDQIAATPAPQVNPGTIMGYGGSSAPSGWLICDGSAVSRTTYSGLFGVIGTSYGAGDGSTTFNLPDLRGRALVGLGTHTSVDSLGDNEGVAVASRRPRHSHTHSLSASIGDHTHSYSVSSAGDHNHSITGASSTANRQSGSASYAASGSVNTSTDGAHSHTAGSTSTDGAHTHGSATGSVGLSGSTVPAYLVVNYIIKT